ncbi:hypothetical protein E2C01_100382 [Portunus trituberculatus]|uniref:Uncharacterized protein n=1 Tax=Portunus trituberculatus TaxID=210409 RepID=A0A5B7K6U2_PORTR|nr:hypothetical protein [Portunus trituberculatus]
MLYKAVLDPPVQEPRCHTQSAQLLGGLSGKPTVIGDAQHLHLLPAEVSSALCCANFMNLMCHALPQPACRCDATQRGGEPGHNSGFFPRAEAVGQRETVGVRQQDLALGRCNRLFMYRFHCIGPRQLLRDTCYDELHLRLRYSSHPEVPVTQVVTGTR